MAVGSYPADKSSGDVSFLWHWQVLEIWIQPFCGRIRGFVGHCWTFGDDISVRHKDVGVNSVGHSPVEERIKPEIIQIIRKCFNSDQAQI